MSRALTALAAALAVSACAPMSSPSPADRAAVPDVSRPCFLPQTVVNYAVDGDTGAYVRAGRNQVYEIRTAFCRGLGASRTLVINGTTGSGGTACVGETIGLATYGPSLNGENNSQCRAVVTRQLTAAEVAELPGRLRP